LRSELPTPVVYVTAHADQETISSEAHLGWRSAERHPNRHLQSRHGVPAADRRRVAATTLRSVGEGIVATNSDGKGGFLNPTAARLTGWEEEQAQGNDWMDVLPLSEGFTGQFADNPIFKLPAGKMATYTLVSRLGQRTPVGVECFENRAEDEILGSIVTIRDIGRRREVEARMMQYQRMDAIANMAGRLAWS
jgi:two-component system, cell cycle sensor histidine kinase and response regulator CckA